MSVSQPSLPSRSFSRWFPWIAGLLLAAGVITFLIVHFGTNTAPSTATPLSNKPAQVPASNGKAIPLPKSARSVAFQFVLLGVTRKNAAVAYRLSGPAIRQGLTLEQWKRAWSNPNVGVAIVPYPASPAAQMQVSYSHSKLIELQFSLYPLRGSNEKPTTFIMDLQKYGTHWRVNNWVPFAPPSVHNPN